MNNNTWAFIGLGNPGNEYKKTRHNVGFCVIDVLSSILSVELVFDTYLNSDIATYYGKELDKNVTLILAKPLGYVNNSGIAVKHILQRFDIPISRCVIICDNIDLAVAQLRLRIKKSKGSTHNGIRSILSHIGDPAFLRIYVGIGLNRPQQSLSSYVLEKWHVSEDEEYQQCFVNAANILLRLPHSDDLSTLQAKSN